MRWLVRRTHGYGVFEENRLAFGAGENVVFEQSEERIEVDSTKIRVDLVDILACDRSRRVVDSVLERVLAPTFLGSELGELAAHGHEIARTAQRVTADVLEDVLALTRMVVGDDVGTEERDDRVAL